MPEHVCPWWMGYLLANPLRRLWQNPAAILSPYVRPGMTVLEPGPGMGFFTLELARLVSPSGRVIVLDIQPRMLTALRRRASRAGLADRVETRQVQPESLEVEDLAGEVDFALAFAVVHEFPDQDRFFAEVAATLRPGGTLLLAEPAGHLDESRFAGELASAERAGLAFVERLAVRNSRAAVLRK